MIFLRVCTNKEDQIEKIAEILLKERLAIDLNLKRKEERLIYEDGKLERSYRIMLTAKTKALLFPTIDKRFRDEFPDDLPELFSTAIVNMDWQQAEALLSEVQSV